MSRAPALARYWSATENEGRGYLRPSTGERAPGVTSITGMVYKDMGQYGADQTAKWAAANWLTWNPGGKSDERAFNGLRYRWKDHRNERGAIGTGVHNYIEDVILGKGPFLDDLDAEQQNMVAQWEEFNFLMSPEYIATERQVWGGRYAGTADVQMRMYSERLGRVATGIGDWKTSRACYPEYHMQIGALKNADLQFLEVTSDTPGAVEAEGKDESGSIVKSWWVEEPMPEFETGWVIHLRDDRWQVFELDHEELHMRRFNAYLDAWHAEKDLKLAYSALDMKLDRPLDWRKASK